MSPKPPPVPVSSLYRKTYDLLTYEIMHLCRQLDHDHFLSQMRRESLLKELNYIIEQRRKLLI